jgi:glycosyltransferase involved in cell wall biosynthesis
LTATIAEAKETAPLPAPRDVLMFGFGSWSDWERLGFPSRNARCTLRLLSDDRFRNVVLFNSPTSPLAAVRAAGTAGRHRRIGLFSSRPRTNLEVHSAVFPLRLQASIGLFRRVNVAWALGWAARQARNAIRRLRPKSVIAWVANPLYAPVAAEIEHVALRVFDAVDDWLERPEVGFLRAEVARGYSIAREKFDLIFTVSERMKERLSEGDSRVRCVHNGYDADLFGLSPPGGEEPEDLAAIPHPRIGYVGMIQSRIDLALCGAIARQRPDWHLVFVGRVLAPGLMQAIDGLPNVHIIGEKAHTEIPRYLHGFDVCAIPHVVDPFTESMDPLKLYEYLACGRPVVTAPVPPTQDYAEVVSIASTGEEFAEAIQRELGRDTEEQRGRRAAAVRDRSWDAVLGSMLDAVLHARGGAGES